MSGAACDPSQPQRRLRPSPLCTWQPGARERGRLCAQPPHFFPAIFFRHSLQYHFPAERPAAAVWAAGNCGASCCCNALAPHSFCRALSGRATFAARAFAALEGCCRTFGLGLWRKPHTCKVEPLYGAVVVVAADHLPKRDAIAVAVCGLIRPSQGLSCLIRVWRWHGSFR